MLPNATSRATAAAKGRALTRTLGRVCGKIVREPLVQFAVLGALVFGVNAWLHPASTGEHVIAVTTELQRQIMNQWDEDHENRLAPELVKEALDLYVTSEILYREGKAMGLDRGDDMIRTRVGHKLQIMIFDDTKVPEPTEAQLRAWFERNHGRYDVPPQASFFLTRPVTEAQARRIAAEINAGSETEEVRNGTRAFATRPLASLAAGLGQDFADALATLPRGSWQVIRSKEGWHVIRLDELVDGVRVPMESVFSQVVEQWRADEARVQANAALARLRAKYTVRYDPAPVLPPLPNRTVAQ